MAPTQQSVAVIGAGAAGLSNAWLLARGGYNVHLYESKAQPGGHANTIDLPIPDLSPSATVPVDVGFIVYNTRTYPDLVSLFQLLAVEEENSSMSFSSSTYLPSGYLLEWGSDSLATLFANRSNLYRPAMYTMLYDMNRFNTAVHDFVRESEIPEYPLRNMSLGQFLDRGAYSPVFIRSYLVPMVSAVWSASFNSALQFPARSLFRFFVNHGLAQVFARPQWRTPAKRSRNYVTRLLDDFQAHGGTVHLSSRVTQVARHANSVNVTVVDSEPVRFDHVVFATHAPITLRILGDSATEDECRILSTFQYSSNKGYVHHDARLMPHCHTVWSSWNFIGRRPGLARRDGDSNTSHKKEQPKSVAKDTPLSSLPNCKPVQHHTRNSLSTDPSISPALVPTEAQDPLSPSDDNGDEDADSDAVCVSYWLNRLQNYHKYHLPVPDLFLTLNPIIPIDKDKILAEISYDHPQFAEAAVLAQAELQKVIQGKNRTWFCGSYTRYGFHEDAMMSGLDVAELLSDYSVIRPWKAKNCLAINNNALPYRLPYSPTRAPLLIFLGALLVLSAVLSRLQDGLGKIASRMTDQDPVVVVASGDGRLHRFGPRHVHRRTSSFFTFSKLQESSLVDLPQPTGARITVRNPRVLSRIADALRQGYELAPTAAAAFAAGELDCPSPTDLSETLRALFIADGLDNPSKARRGRAKLAENLLSAVVGNFEEVRSMSVNTRLSELTTCMSNVISPAWWLELEQSHSEALSVGQDVFKPLVSKVSPFDLKNSSQVLELLGDLSEMTVSLLRNNSLCRATIVVQTSERRNFVIRKADLLSIGEQVIVTLLDQFISQRTTGFGASCDLDKDETQYDVIFSPGMVNAYKFCGFQSMEDFMVLLQSVAAPKAVIEIGAVVYGRRMRGQDRKAKRMESLLSGDNGYRLWEATDLLSLAELPSFDLRQVAFMNEEEAAMDTFEVIQRVFNSLATEKLEKSETRMVLAQMCLWQAALGVKHLRRIALSFTLS